MPAEQASSSGLTWLIFAAMTVGSWGLYGIFLHTGQIAMADPVNGRYKAFLLVGVAYLLTAVIGSMVVLWINGSDWSFPARGLTWSLLAGTVGAIGAFGVLLAFGARGTPCRGDVDRICRRACRERGGIYGDAPTRGRIERSELAVRLGDRAGGAGWLSGDALQAGVLKPEELSAFSCQPRAKGENRIARRQRQYVDDREGRYLFARLLLPAGGAGSIPERKLYAV